MATDDVIVMENDVSRFGLRRVHVMRLGNPVVADGMVEKYVPCEVSDYDVFNYCEEEVGMWHLWVVWKAREVVRLTPTRPIHLPLDLPLQGATQPPTPSLPLTGAFGRKGGKKEGEETLDRGLRQEGGELGVLWYVEKGGRVSWAADLAATLYRMRLGRWPGRVLVQALPVGGQDEVILTPSRFDGVEEVGSALRLEVAEWMPKGFVAVC